MPLFEKRPEIPRQQFKALLKKANVKIGPGRQLSNIERGRIEKTAFPKRFGPSISKSEYLRSINRLRSEKMQTRDFAKKTKLGKEIKFLEELEKQSDSSK